MSAQRKFEGIWFEPAPWVNGRYVRSDVTRCIVNPATGAKLAEVHFANPQIATDAIDGAVIAQRSWKELSAFERGNILKTIAAELIEQKDKLATLLTAEQGKPYWQSVGEIDYAASFFQWYGEEARRISGRIASHPQRLRTS